MTMTEMSTIDGSFGEGGGQVLRSSLALSIITGRPVRFVKIRAGRPRPGLARQHLTAVRAAAAISGARISGDEIGSTELTFEPTGLFPGLHRFSVGTAGSTTLVLQTVLWPLLLADGDSEVSVEGGTHNDKAPPFDAIDRSLLPILRTMGVDMSLELDQPGFQPAGGGRIVASIRGRTKWRPLELHHRGPVEHQHARAMVANLPIDVARRELQHVETRLGWSPRDLRTERVKADGPGNIVLLEVRGAASTMVISAVGDRGVRAEAVAERACAELETFLEADVPVDEHTADQLLIPMALAGGGSFTTSAPSLHTQTNAAIIERFLPVRVSMEPVDGRRHRVDVLPNPT